jgi:ATP-binding cassette subfamily B protein
MIGEMMAFINYAMMIVMSFLMISVVGTMLPRANAAAERIEEVLRTMPSIEDAASTLTSSEGESNEEVLRTIPSIEDGAPALTSSESESNNLEFRDVSFCFPHADENALSDISFVAETGKTLAIIGGTGSGKTTLMNLIVRMADVSSGAILLGGVDIREMSQKALREKISFATQKAKIFTGSVRENIAFGQEEKSDDEILAAAKIAQADFVLERGLDDEISQGGMNLSGGQKQRLSIARAVLRDAQIYIIDDSLSALDFRTERDLRKALAEKTRGKTVIIASQRIGSIMNADLILLLDDGEIIARGTHAQLLKTSDVYREMVESQLGASEDGRPHGR